MADRGEKQANTPTLHQYVNAYAPGCLHWHTPNGDHYASLLQTNLLMANTEGNQRPEGPNTVRGGQMIHPLPEPAQLYGVEHDQVYRANVVPDVEMMTIALIEFHDKAYWCSMWHDMHQVLIGKQQVAKLMPMSEADFRDVF